MLAVSVTLGSGFSFGTPQYLFGVNIRAGQGAGIMVTDNGQRILINELPPVDPTNAGARLIQNWSAGGWWAVIVGERAASTLRKLYATPWNPWTLVETLDNKLGAISRKTLKWRHDVLPS